MSLFFMGAVIQILMFIIIIIINLLSWLLSSLISHMNPSCERKKSISISCADLPVKGHLSPVPVVGYLLKTP